MSDSSETEFEMAARREMTCLGCNNQKSEDGMVVCWNCWSQHRVPFKYYQGDLAEWLKEIGRSQ